MHRTTYRLKYSRPIVFALTVGMAAITLYWLFTELNSADSELHTLILKVLSLLGLGAIMVIAISSVSRVDEKDR